MTTSLRNVSFKYLRETDDNIPADTGVSNLTIDFSPGSCTLITGPSGSGKSSVLKLLNGLIPELYEGDLSGRTLLGGLDTASTDIQRLGQTAGMVFQNPRSQFFTANVLEELAFASENAGEAPETTAQYVAAAINTWGIRPLMNRSLQGLSGGESQLVACAAAMVGPQKILLLDEPTSNLSPAAIDLFTAVLQRLKTAGWTLIVAEHRVYPLNKITDWTVIMREGRITYQLRGDEFFAIPEMKRRELGLRTLTKPQPQLRHAASEMVAPAVTAPGVEVRNLRFSYGKRQVLGIEELCLAAGSVVALTGPNGAGKTTLARTLVGLAKPQKNTEIKFQGKVCDCAERQKRSALVMQDVNRQLFAETVAQEVSLGNGEISREQIEALLEELGLKGLEQRHPMTLSGGQKQRLVIANAVASDAQLYVFDEPTSGVDYRNLMSISSLIRRLAGRGKSVLVISHDLEFINEVADRHLQLEPFDKVGYDQIQDLSVNHRTPGGKTRDI